MASEIRRLFLFRRKHFTDPPSLEALRQPTFWSQLLHICSSMIDASRVYIGSSSCPKVTQQCRPLLSLRHRLYMRSSRLQHRVLDFLSCSLRRLRLLSFSRCQALLPKPGNTSIFSGSHFLPLHRYSRFQKALSLTKLHFLRSYSDDPGLVTALGGALINGLQGSLSGLGDFVAATAKHFLADGGTTGGKDEVRLSEFRVRAFLCEYGRHRQAFS